MTRFLFDFDLIAAQPGRRLYFVAASAEDLCAIFPVAISHRRTATSQ